MLKTQLATKMNAVSTSDMVLAGDINDALQANKYLRRTGSDGVDIHVQGGVVTLSGHVKTATNKTVVDTTVRGVSGIAQLKNQLVADDRLTMTVAQTLGNDVRMGGEQIGINAQYGFIYLTGKTGSATQRLLAAKIVASVPQVRGIINRIQAPSVVVDDLEEQIAQPAIGQTVYTTSEELGNVRQVIVQPASRRVSAIVIGMQGITQPAANTVNPGEQSYLISMKDLRCAASGALFLTLRKDKTTSFVDYDAQNFIPPPVDWQPPYPYEPGDVLFSRERIS